jgi:hypothetical protein
MKALLMLTAALETATGLALLWLPLRVVALLVGGSLDTPAALVVARIAAAALLAIGVACWLARNEVRTRAARGVVTAILVYNAGTVAVLVYAAIGLGLFGIGLWPVTVAHGILAVWCVASLRPRAARISVEPATPSGRSFS